MHIRKDDIVEVIAGDDAGTPSARVTARVLRVLPKVNKIVVEGIARVKKHVKPNRRNAQGGILSKESAIDVSNVMLFCPTCRRGTRLGRRYGAEGQKVRYCKKCSNEYPGKPLSKPRKAYAKQA